MHSNILKRAAQVLGAAAITATMAAGVSAEPAAANSAYGCTWPRVCFYSTQSDANAWRPTATYRKRTSYWQWLGSRARHSYMVYNSTNDDCALLLFSKLGGGSYTRPLYPNQSWSTDYGWWYEFVIGVRIMDDPECRW